MEYPFTSIAIHQIQIIFDKPIQSEITFLQDNDEVFIYSKHVVSTYDKLLTEIKVIEVEGGERMDILGVGLHERPNIIGKQSI